MPIPDNTDKDKLSEVTLAILWLGAHGDKCGTRVWKNVDWDLTDLLFEKGWISYPKSKSKSVMLTDDGEELAEKYFSKYFSKGT
ncbi:MAG: DUF6429 family protein [Candidatus Scalindua sp.]